MKFLNYYSKFFESSQSKKIRQYIGYSIVLKWYEENKQKIAEMLGVKISDLASEDTLMQQSYELVNQVINPQMIGNTGISGTDIPGFESFKKIENNLIHDILHNLFNVKYKEFNKSLSNIEFTESEIVEEIECLAIEESFMKYMNINYPKTDFINANINQLASYLMMAILKNDPKRIKKILDKEEKPYLEVYDKKYLVEGTAFETFFELFKNHEADNSFRIYNSDDLKEYMIKLINIGEGINKSSGDRALYPDGEYFGLMTWYDLDDSEKQNKIEYRFDDIGSNKRRYILISETDYYIEKWNFDYVVLGAGINLLNEIETDEKTKKRIDNKVKNLLDKLGFNENGIKYTDLAGLQVFPHDIKYDSEEIQVAYLNKENNKIYRGYINIDNIPKYLQPQLKIESALSDFKEDNFKDRENLKAIPIKAKFIDTEVKWVDIDDWFNFLNEFYGQNIVYKIGDKKYVGIIKTEEEEQDSEGNWETIVKYEILTSYEFEEIISEDYNNNSEDNYPNNHEFINFENYREKTFEEVTKELFNDSDSISIMRRNFRLGDIIKNNLSIGNLNIWREKTKTIDTKNPNHKYLDFEGGTNVEKSLSKAILTDNGKKLLDLLNNFRGYVIKNFDKIKAEFKNKKQKFSEKDIEIFKKINIQDLKVVNNFNQTDIDLTIEINFNLWNKIDLNLSSNIKTLGIFFKNFEDIQRFSNLIQNIDDIDYLKNFVNLKGFIKTTKDYYDFRKLVTSVSKKDIFKLKPVVSYLTSFKDGEIKINSETANKIKNFYKNSKSDYNLDLNNSAIKPLVESIIKEYLPNLKYKTLKVTDFNSYDIDVKINIPLKYN